jgi:hypothetical protein
MGLGYTEGGEGNDDMRGSRRSRRRRGQRGERMGRGRRGGKGGKRADGREERIERGGRSHRNDACAAIQPHRVVSVPVPTLAADAIVDGDIDLSVQCQSEDVGGGECVAPLPP